MMSPVKTYTFIDSSFPSAALGRESQYRVVLPDGDAPDGGWPVLMLLHGLGRDHKTATDADGFTEWFAGRRFALLCPNGERGWYVDSPAVAQSNYASMLKEVLGQAVAQHPLSGTAEKTAVAGWSMGGYGTAMFAAENPQRICALGCMIPLLDFPTEKIEAGQPFGIPREFGTDPAFHAQVNPRNHVATLRGKQIFVAAGTQAFEYPMVQRFCAELEAQAMPYEHTEFELGHEWNAVAAALPKLFDFVESVIAQ